MQIGVNGRLTGINYQRAAQQRKSDSAVGSWIESLAEAAKAGEAADPKTESAGKKESGAGNLLQLTAGEEKPEEAKASGERPEAAKIFEAAAAGRENPLTNLRKAGKVPYAHLAKDGIIEYNGVIFVCDEKTNSICLGDVSDPKQVINVTLSGGGHLKMNRKNIGDLSRAAGMFSPEDLNLIMRAIAQDTKIQSMEKEIEDLESSVGKEMGAESETEQEES